MSERGYGIIMLVSVLAFTGGTAFGRDQELASRTRDLSRFGSSIEQCTTVLVRNIAATDSLNAELERCRAMGKCVP